MPNRPGLNAVVALLAGRRLVTRFAPSPTGYLHLGHVVNAIYTWGVARAVGGRVLLRIEDHDVVRSRPEYESALLQDLEWLGFAPDTGRYPLQRQSDRPERYEVALSNFRGLAHLYACGCSRRDIGGERYANTCRHSGLAETVGRGLRIAIDHGNERFADLLLGNVEQAPAEQCGDLLLRDRDGHWTYQLAVTVDDYLDGVTLVIRGADLLSSTGRQIRLARLLGRTDPPLFLHHPLVLQDPRAGGTYGRGVEKLSKSSGDTGVRDLRSAGVSPADVIGRAAAAVGLIAHPRPVTAAQVADLFR